MDQLDLTDIYRTFHPKIIHFTFSQVHTEHSPGQITSWAINLALVHSKKIEIISGIFSKHNAIRLDVKYRKKKKKLLKIQTHGG